MYTPVYWLPTEARRGGLKQWGLVLQAFVSCAVWVLRSKL